VLAAASFHHAGYEKWGAAVRASGVKPDWTVVRGQL